MRYNFKILKFVPFFCILSLLLIMDKLYTSFLTVLTISIYLHPENSLVEATGSNLRPIIGVLSQEYFVKGSFETNTSYIAASYVKFLEGAGSQVIPIMINQTEDYYNFIFQRINGLLLPGGGVMFNETGGYGEAGRILLKLAEKSNNAGDYFPVWGTCLGFEFLLYQAADQNYDIQVPCQAYNVLDTIKFTKDTWDSRLFSKAPKSIIKALRDTKTAANFHHYCITPETFSKFKADQTYRILSINYDSGSNLTYISTIEGIKLPFYGVQFHPEKNLYEWSEKEKIPHSPEALQTAQYFANYFVGLARKSNHTFESSDEENKFLIYNHSPTFTGNISNFTQIYFFPISHSYSNEISRKL